MRVDTSFLARPLAQLIDDCTHDIAAMRPTFNEVITRLNRLTAVHIDLEEMMAAASEALGDPATRGFGESSTMGSISSGNQRDASTQELTTFAARSETEEQELANELMEGEAGRYDGDVV